MGSKLNVRNRTVTVNVILTWRLRESRRKVSEFRKDEGGKAAEVHEVIGEDGGIQKIESVGVIRQALREVCGVVCEVIVVDN